MIYILPTAVLLFIGWLIKYKEAAWLISGYNIASKDEKDKYDVKKLCKYVGNFIFILAGIFLGMALATILFHEYIDLITGVGFGMLAVVLVCEIVYLNTGNRVRK